MWTLENTVEAEEIICDREEKRDSYGLPQLLTGPYSARPIGAMNVSTNAREIQLSISLPDSPTN